MLFYQNYVSSEKRIKIAPFVANAKKQTDNIVNSLKRTKTSLLQIENAVSKSSPDIGLDPQLEPLVSSFSSSINDVYNDINDQFMIVKEFEASLISNKSAEALLKATDSTIAIIISQVATSPTSKGNSRKLERSQKLQKEAYKAFVLGNSLKASKLTNNAFYTASDILPQDNSASDFDQIYATLIDEILAIGQLVDDSESETVKKMFVIMQNNIRKANKYNRSDNSVKAVKELSIGNYLLTKIASKLAEIEK